MKYFNILATAAISLLLVACSSESDKTAFKQYELAKKNRDLHQLHTALITLNTLDPESFESELNTIKQSVALLKQLNSDLSFSSNYLISHQANLLFNSKQAKQAIVQHGSQLNELIKINQLITSALTEPAQLTVAFTQQLQALPLNKWPLVDLNSQLKHTINAKNALEQALQLAKLHKLTQYAPETEALFVTLRLQLTLKLNLIDKVYIVAFTKSADEIRDHNRFLTDKSSPLLSSFNPDNALNAMQPLFIKAQEQYAPFLLVTNNLMTHPVFTDYPKIHQALLDWSQLERDILMPYDNFVSYSQNSEQRVDKINTILVLLNQQHQQSSLEHAQLALNDIQKQHPQAFDLMEKLKHDSVFVYSATYN